MAQIDVRGDIIGNDDKLVYDWFGWDSTCPSDIKTALETKEAGEMLKVTVNSGGGDVRAGQEIYSMLRGRDDVEIEIQSMAGSAASVIAMSNKCTISPVAMIMIHNVSVCGACGDYHDMKKTAEVLQEYNSALANAYMNKTGMTEDEVLKLMDRETWLSANKALELGFVDGITGETVQYTNTFSGMRLTDELREKAVAEMAKKEQREADKTALLDELKNYGGTI